MQNALYQGVFQLVLVARMLMAPVCRHLLYNDYTRTQGQLGMHAIYDPLAACVHVYGMWLVLQELA